MPFVISKRIDYVLTTEQVVKYFNRPIVEIHEIQKGLSLFMRKH